MWRGHTGGDARTWKVATRASKSSAVMRLCGPYEQLAAGSSLATFCQMAPVPPSVGKRKIALGPQPASSFLCSTLEMALLTSTVATRSPIHDACIIVVGTPHTCAARGAENRAVQCVRERDTPLNTLHPSH